LPLNISTTLIGIILLFAIYQPIFIKHVDDSVLGSGVRVYVSFVFFLLLLLVLWHMNLIVILKFVHLR